MRFIYIVAVLIIITTGSVLAADTYEEYLKQQMAEYQNYLDEIDREFSDFLKQTWYEYSGEEPEKLLEEPKPVQVPVAEPDKKPEPVKIQPKPAPKVPAAKPESKPKPAPVPSPDPAQEPKEPVVKAPEPQEPAVEEPQPQYEPSDDRNRMALSFYGRKLSIPYNDNIKAVSAKPLSSDNIAGWWEKVASSDYKETLETTLRVGEKLNLGDWGYLNLIERFAGKLLGDVPERKMLVWFFLTKAGYDAKLGYTKSGETFVLMPSDSELYGVTYYVFSDVKYYIADVFGKNTVTDSLYTYRGKYPKAEKQLSFSKMTYPKLGFTGFERELEFEIDGSRKTVQAIANRYNVAYFSNFPQADLSVYTKAKVPNSVEKTMLPGLRKLVDGKSPKEAVDILLRFVQTAFKYRTDEAQFGREKFLFAEETIAYPYSDCEDRAVLFVYLVRELLGLDAVMLDFPGHIAAAVNLGRENTGAVLEYKGKKYSVTDPTYINATAGMVMPDYKNASPVIVEPEI